VVKTLFFATSNPEKIQIAQTACAGTGIVLEPISLEIDEIQGEDPELIVRNKVMRAFDQLGKPVVVSDDTWAIRALKGFPGAYMKSLNYWFTPEDFLRLMNGVEDRHITLRQFLAYTDGITTKVFKNDLEGQIINEVRGTSKKSPCMTVIVLDSDNGKTIAEVFEQGQKAVVARYKNRRDAWHSFIDWYTGKDEY
jgi:XTP/dITP diphosphohydrolase